MRGRGILAAVLLACASPAVAQAFDAAPWLADLEQMRQAFHEKYANLDWLENEREIKLDPLFDQAADAIRRGPDEAKVRSMFDGLQRKLGDGHVEVVWPESTPKLIPAAASAHIAPNLCREIGYDRRQNGKGTAQALPGYEPLGGQSPFDAGIAPADGTKIGVLRIGIFQPQGYPDLCRAAVRELAIPADKHCDEQCQDKILTWAYRQLTAALEDRIRQLKAAGATVLLIDITNNGGGSEWAEAAARIFTAKQLVSEQRGFVRGEHWAKQWRELAANLRELAKDAPATDKKRLLAWADEADGALRQALASCPRPSDSCPRLGAAGYSTGLVGSAPSGAFAGRDWGVLVFSPAQFPYHDGVWEGPLIVLVDQKTWSAAEEFAAVLQDNKAAIILGARTGGAGCGYTYGVLRRR